jgi:hypothetical protein
LWAKRAADAGLAKAMYAVGYFTEVGIGTPANMQEYVYLLDILHLFLILAEQSLIINGQRSWVINVLLSGCGDHRRKPCISQVGLVRFFIAVRMTAMERVRIVSSCKVVCCVVDGLMDFNTLMAHTQFLLIITSSTIKHSCIVHLQLDQTVFVKVTILSTYWTLLECLNSRSCTLEYE